ncbi:MAG: hypothetical protein KJO50_08125, partial [Bacteroidia bacterium]|nr:hypothetical protein [Bacteroidia bacterium]
STSAKTCTKAEKIACAKDGKKCDKSCEKACCSKASASAAADAEAETKVASALSEADVVAEGDENIIRKVCDYSGSVSYYKKEVCEKSGKVSMAEVQFDDESKSFVNVSPEDAMADKEAKVVKAAATSGTKAKKKACCAGKSKKSCAKGKEGA